MSYYILTFWYVLLYGFMYNYSKLLWFFFFYQQQFINKLSKLCHLPHPKDMGPGNDTLINKSHP